MLKPLFFISFFAVLACQSKPQPETPKYEKSDALWRIINEDCLPQPKGQCTELSGNYVVIKDRRGDLQYLLLPRIKVSGMESPEILDSQSPNYFFEAWKARAYMTKKHGSMIDDRHVSLAINSQGGRTQNQLHIHISCVKEEVMATVSGESPKISKKWAPFPGGLLGHAYWARRLSDEELAKNNIFLLVAGGVPEAKANMKEFGIGLVRVKKGFVLLADRMSAKTLDRASVEEIQDHDCGLLKK